MQCRKWLAVVWTHSLRAPPRGGILATNYQPYCTKSKKQKEHSQKREKERKPCRLVAHTVTVAWKAGKKLEKSGKELFCVFFPFSFLACGKTGKRSGGRKLKLRRTAIRERKGEREETSGRDKDPPPPNHLFFSLLLLKTFPFLLSSSSSSSCLPFLSFYSWREKTF